MPTFIARSGSFNDLKITNLASSSKANIVAIDSASGQLFYMSTSSFGGSGGSGTPGGSNKQIQFNSASAFSGSSNLTYDYIAGNLIYNAPDLGYSYPELINNPDNYSSSVLIGIGLTGSTYPVGGNAIYAPFTAILGMFNEPNILADPTDPNTFSSIPTFIVGNGDWFSNYPNTLARANAIEVGYDFTSFLPYIKLPQLLSNNPGYVITFNPTTKRLSYSAFTVVGGSDKQIQFNNNGTLAGAAGFNFITGSSNVLQFTGSLNISGSEYIKGSGSAIFKTDGSVGPLLTVNDSNSGSLFTVNDISGLPIVDVRSDSSVLMGSSNVPSLNTTKKVVSTGAQAFSLGGTLIPTASYDGAFFEYIAKSGSNARSGYITSTWSGSSIVSSSITSSNIGTTTGLVTFAAISGSYIVLSGSANAANWTVKSIIRAI
tara:strand:- start:4923 stop:6212 length:1290 start_codon:yes stop_codon:yes gene_type:complete